MFKKLFVGLLPTIIITANLCTTTAQSTTVTTISTPRQFCEYTNQFLEQEYAKDCSMYSNEVGAPLVTDEGLRILEGENIVFKDMNFTYDMIRSPFIFEGGKLTIDGGKYRTSDTCFFSLWYNTETGETNMSGLEIISGDFIADNKHGDLAKSPICLAPDQKVTNEEAEKWLSKVLAPNSYYTEFKTDKKINLQTDLIDTVKGFGKDRNDMYDIKEFNSNSVSVREIIPSEEDDEEESGPEDQEEEANSVELEEQEENTEESEKEPESTPILPKTPNTGVGKM